MLKIEVPYNRISLISMKTEKLADSFSVFLLLLVWRERKKVVFLPTESCRSGRTGQTRNLLSPSGFRGFESLTFRKGNPVCVISLFVSLHHDS